MSKSVGGRVVVGQKHRPRFPLSNRMDEKLGVSTHRCRAVMERADRWVNRDSVIVESPRWFAKDTKNRVAYLRRKSGVPVNFDGEPRKDLLRFLVDANLKYWVGGFTEIYNGMLLRRRGDYQTVVDDWIERYTLCWDEDGKGVKPYAEYILAWHVVVYEPLKDIEFKLNGSHGVLKRITHLQDRIASSRSAVKVDRWLNLGASIGRFAAVEALSYLLGIGVAKKLYQLTKAARWLTKLGRTGQFVARHSKTISEVASAVLVTALKSQGSVGEMSVAGLGSILTKRAAVVMEGLGLAAGLLEVAMSDMVETLDRQIRNHPDIKAKTDVDHVVIDIIKMEAELKVLDAYRMALNNLLMVASQRLTTQYLQATW